MDLKTASKIVYEMSAYLPKIKNALAQRVDDYVVVCYFVGESELTKITVESEDEWEKYKALMAKPDRAPFTPSKPHPISAQEADKIFNPSENMKTTLQGISESLSAKRDSAEQTKP